MAKKEFKDVITNAYGKKFTKKLYKLLDGFDISEIEFCNTVSFYVDYFNDVFLVKDWLKENNYSNLVENEEFVEDMVRLYEMDFDSRFGIKSNLANVFRELKHFDKYADLFAEES